MMISSIIAGEYKVLKFNALSVFKVLALQL